ncbi:MULTISPECIES: TonB-dependent receptor [Rhodopseudomonas]|uniref:Ligand-gated channel protein n=1 Tax=Rhodopseudomonas palustris TaxID=1076 RepID=A0A0D7E8K2_RHOPL|nr:MULTISPECIES: TonB-dependent receptor [Rhodopseudomonas]KIZ35882.1 ligand-gated channel protein [Rhodopseudomonas palustris]MDF3810573.1 TonB-dependent receptor [Rhodopseudomonas sp. BAL398]WOK16152.1 TonB-dependent receptor [Rhodopseudomonas sp. BAL398]
MSSRYPAARRSSALSRACLTSTMLVSILPPCVAQAQQADATTALPTLVVSATRLATPAEQIASSVTVITSEELERDQRRTVSDALTMVPGLNVVRTGGPGGSTSVFMRGTNSNHVKVLIDGIDAGDPSKPNGAYDFANLLTADIERIEVLRGPQSGLYGSDAIGGVISITTKRGQGPAKLTGTLEGGSFGTFNQTARAAGSQGNLDYAFNVAHFRSTDVAVTPRDLLAPGQQRINDSYDNQTYSTKLGVQASDDLAFSFVGRYSDASKGFTGDDYSHYPNTFPESLQSNMVSHDFLTRSEAIWSPLGDRFKSTLGFSYSNQWNRTVNPNADFTTNNQTFAYGIAPPSSYRGERTKFDWTGVVDAGYGQKVVLGLERQDDSIRTNSTGDYDLSGAYQQLGTTASTGNSAGFVELQSEFTKNFFLVSNIRYDDNDSFGGHTTWRVAPTFIVPYTDTRLKATYGTGFKAPTLMQLYVNNPAYYTIANPALKPETSKGYDVGFEQPLFQNRASFGATYFNNEITDLISMTGYDLALGGYSYENVGLAKTYGVESFVALQATETLRFRVDYTYTHTRDEDSGLRLRRRPDNKVTLSAIWNPIERATLSASIVHTSSWLDYDRFGTTLLDAPSFTVVNLAANYQIDEHATVFGRIDNLFDKTYQVPVGFLQPGLGVFAGMRLSN